MPGAVIFDMDGVLADTEPMNQRAQDEVLARHGVSLTDAEYATLIGLSNGATWRWLIDRFGLSGTPAALAAEYVAALRPAISEGLHPAAGVVELIAQLTDAGTRLGLASSSPRGAVDAVTEALGLSGAFGAVVCDEDVTNGKPAPDLFLLAAARLSVAPERCVVIEDSLHGLEAAAAAGMTAIGLRTRYNRAARLKAPHVVESLAELI
ncbi:MAG TPA: HAD family phosphatase [Candidatus Limnocylindria bacterium]